MKNFSSEKTVKNMRREKWLNIGFYSALTLIVCLTLYTHLQHIGHH